MSTREQTVGTEELPALPGWARSRPFFRRRDGLEGQAANEPSWIKSPESSPGHPGTSTGSRWAEADLRLLGIMRLSVRSGYAAPVGRAPPRCMSRPGLPPALREGVARLLAALHRPSYAVSSRRHFRPERRSSRYGAERLETWASSFLFPPKLAQLASATPGRC